MKWLKIASSRKRRSFFGVLLPRRSCPTWTDLVSVRRVLESYESSVIQGGGLIRGGVTDVDEQEPRPLRPQQVAISKRSDRRRMETGRTPDPARQDWPRQAHGDHAGGDKRPDVRSHDQL